MLETTVVKATHPQPDQSVEVKLEHHNLERLLGEHQADIWRYLRFLGAGSADAEDLTQETFLALELATFEERSRAETAAYLRKVARNQFLMWRRAHGNKINTVDLAAAETAWADITEPNGAASDGFAGLLAALKQCLEKIEGRARSAIDRFYQQGEGREAVAAALNMKPDGVKTLLRRTRDALRECIERKQRE
ncbi:RNA polymerase sigma factor [Adhaeretor mobilis]|uniref:RNA polymerase sigma factor n=1 Tax=Adhaeretor mobilis TaxID=1930276 RepID=A0A517MU96_9BACT|nr:sigma-70 family RNA polymerase sigma factor [Adhaeretor mobilis]QDS98458.1 RNA polymerase sigma factor [Adhaeretor mobilis]